jgi:hypothetical protein
MARIYTYTVEGEGFFPLDMLRYDCCWPSRGVDVAMLKRRAKRSVQLLSYRKSTRERWESYGWAIVMETVI